MKSGRMMQIVVATALASGTLAASAPTASAADGRYRCPKGWFCLFEHSDGSGAIAKFSRTGSSKLRNTHQFEDKASYVWNRTGNVWVVYEDPRYGGRRVPYGPGQQDNLANDGGFWNDRISSVLKFNL